MLIIRDLRLLHGNPAKAAQQLGWKCTIGFEELIKEMVDADLKAAQNSSEDHN